MPEIPTISIAGAGNVAFHLGKALVSAGIAVDRIYNRTFEKAQKLAGQLGAVAVSRVDELAASDVVICCVSDAAVPDLVPEISVLAPVITTSGTIDVLSLQHSHPVGVLYPLQTFSGSVPVDFSHLPLFTEGSTDDMRLLLATLGNKLSDTVIELPARRRAELHVAAVFISNFTNHMVDLGQQFLEKHHMPFHWLKPLLHETIAKLDRQSAHDAQTGPARRHDEITLNRHMAALSPQQAELYRILSNSIQQGYSNA